jgi:hypothetical protein
MKSDEELKKTINFMIENLECTDNKTVFIDNDDISRLIYLMTVELNYLRNSNKIYKGISKTCEESIKINKDLLIKIELLEEILKEHHIDFLVI